jgi:hypothetical protein
MQSHSLNNWICHPIGSAGLLHRKLSWPAFPFLSAEYLSISDSVFQQWTYLRSPGLSKVAGHRRKIDFCRRLLPPKNKIYFKFLFNTSIWFHALFHGWKFAHRMSSHSQESLSIIQVKQNKISWDKFLQIPADFEIISQQIRDWNTYIVESLQIQFRF